MAAGDFERALAMLEVARVIQPGSGYASFQEAIVYARLGRAADAVAMLRGAAAAGSVTREAVDGEPAFTSLRQDSAFTNILQTLPSRPRDG